jgi:DNA-binding NarL/FixJ family response regulator
MSSAQACLRIVEAPVAAESTMPPPLDEQPTLRQRAILNDARSSSDINLALLWRELLHGLCRVVDGFLTADRGYLVLAPQQGAQTGIEGRRREILEAVLCGIGQKGIAIDHGLAPSTVALNARLGLEALGVHSKPSRVHPLLMLIASASCERDTALSGRRSFVIEDQVELRVISFPRPDRRLSAVLPPAELEVVRCLVEGLPYAEIARIRGTSARTVANQITAVFRRMRVSGRNELLHKLFLADGLGRGPNGRTTGILPLAPKPLGKPLSSATGR